MCALYSDRIIVKYVGEPVCLVTAAHGNSTTGRPYVRTWPSVIEQIKSIAVATGGHTGPAKIYKEAVTGASSEDVTAYARDMKQVYKNLIMNMCESSIDMDWQLAIAIEAVAKQRLTIYN